MPAANWLASVLAMFLGSASASAQGVNCADVAEIFASRLALNTGAMDEDGAFVLLRNAAEEDLRSCPDLEPQRYYLARMAELGYAATGARRSDGPDAGARALAEESLHKHPLSVRIATVAARLDGSVEAAQRASALDPGYAPARIAFAAALARKGDTSDALATLTGASRSASAMITRARIKLAAGDANGAFAEALAVRNAARKEPEPTPGRDILRDSEELLGLSSRALGKSLEARKYFERAALLGSAKAREALVEIAPGDRQGASP